MTAKGDVFPKWGEAVLKETWQHHRKFTVDNVKSVAPYRLVLGKGFQNFRSKTHDFQQLFPLYIFRIFQNNRVILWPQTYGTLCVIILYTPYCLVFRNVKETMAGSDEGTKDAWISLLKKLHVDDVFSDEVKWLIKGATVIQSELFLSPGHILAV
jgi:hypothetical protein